MNVFVAGATGVLGRPTVKAFVEAGHQVRGAGTAAGRLDDPQREDALAEVPLVQRPRGIYQAIAGNYKQSNDVFGSTADPRD